MLKKKIGANFKELQNVLPKQLSLSSQKYGFGIRDNPRKLKTHYKDGNEFGRLDKFFKVIRTYISEKEGFLQSTRPSLKIWQNTHRTDKRAFPKLKILYETQNLVSKIYIRNTWRAGLAEQRMLCLVGAMGMAERSSSARHQRVTRGRYCA
jgi:hypothetical protein